jgi:hypothetical protein
MAVAVLLIVLAVIAFLLYQSVQDARRRAAGGEPSPAPAPRRSPPKGRAKPKPRPRKVKVDEEALAQHVAKLRDAVANDLISMEEAVDSVVRQTDGAITEEAARKLLSQGPSAA